MIFFQGRKLGGLDQAFFFFKTRMASGCSLDIVWQSCACGKEIGKRIDIFYFGLG